MTARLGLGLAALLFAPACRESESLVYVSVAADPAALPAVQLRVTAYNGGAQQVRSYPAAPRSQPIPFPATFGLLLPHARAGDLQLLVEALDRQAAVLAAGRAGGSLVGGGRLDLSVTLQAAPPPRSDGGVDASPADGPLSLACADASACPAGYPCKNQLCLPPGLVLYWKLDDSAATAADSSGNGHHGSYTSSGDGGTGGPLRSGEVPPTRFANPASRQFSSVERQAVTLSSLPAELRPANDFTVSVFYRSTSVAMAGADLVSGGNQYLLRLRPQTFEFAKQVMASGNTRSTVSCPASSGSHLDGRWHHLAATSSASAGVAVYLDGVIRCELPLTQDVVYDSSEALWVGRHGAGSTTYDFDGNLDEVRIYDRVLTPAEIADLAAGGN